jgi:hypothetical protein
MKVPLITPELKAAAETLLGAQAYKEVIRPVVDGYQRAVLADYRFRVASAWIERGEEDRVILEPSESYLLEDDDAHVVYADFHAAAIAHGFNVHPGHCPLLVAERMVAQAERDLLSAAQYITKIDPDEIGDMRLRKDLIDLTLNFVVTSAGVTTASVLAGK